MAAMFATSAATDVAACAVRTTVAQFMDQLLSTVAAEVKQLQPSDCEVTLQPVALRERFLPPPRSLAFEQHCHLVLQDVALFAYIASWASQGSLQALGMTSKQWSVDAYAPTVCAWNTIDMADWPFALREVRTHSGRRNGGPGSCNLRKTSDKSQGHGADLFVPIGDRDVQAALRRLASGQLLQLSACNQGITDLSIKWALQAHSVSLVELRLGSCKSGFITGHALAPLAKAMNLKVLELHHILRLSLFDIICTYSGLEHLHITQSVLSARSVEAIARCRKLKVLKLSFERSPFAGRNRLPVAPFLSVFSSCSCLRSIDIHSATEVTNELLVCIMAHIDHLTEFRGSREFNGVLDAAVVNTFKTFYPGAQSIVVDDVFEDLAQEAVTRFMETMLAAVNDHVGSGQ